MSNGAVGEPATINDVARVAGVSRQTVTRAMNDMSGISAPTKQRVLRAAQDLRYRPSRFGRGLVKNDRRTLGLVVDDLTNPYYPELASAVIGAAAGRGWNVVVAERRHTSDQARLLADLAGQVDAVIGYLGTLSLARSVELPGMPVVDVDPQEVVPGHARVQFDKDPAIRAAVEHLVGSGVRRPVMVDVSGRGERSDRTDAFAAAFAGYDIGLDVVFAPDSSVPAGAAAATVALRRFPDLDAIVAFNDITACGALRGLRARRVEVPDQVRVLGIDGLSIGSYVNPELTTLALDFDEIARAAVDLVAALANDPDADDPDALLRTVGYRLLVRASG